MQSIATCYLKLIFKVSLSLGISVEIISVIESCLLQDTRGVLPRGEKKKKQFIVYSMRKKISHIGIIYLFPFMVSNPLFTWSISITHIPIFYAG